MNKTILKLLATTFAVVVISSSAFAVEMTATKYKTSSAGTKWICENGTVDLEVKNEDRTPPGPDYTYNSTTYEWSDGGQGASATGTLDTTAKGEKTPKCKLTHNFTCPTGPDKTTTETATLGFAVRVVKNDTAGCSPDPPTGYEINTQKTDSHGSKLQRTEWLGLLGQWKWDYYWAGTWTNIHAQESFTPDGQPQNEPCGDPANDSKQGQTQSFSVTYDKLTVSYSYTGVPEVGNKPAKEFTRYYWRWFEYKHTPTKGTFSGTETGYGPGGQNAGPYNKSGTFSFTGASAKRVGWHFATCEVECCP